jgi:CDP-diglyceride synthetase
MSTATAFIYVIIWLQSTIGYFVKRASSRHADLERKRRVPRTSPVSTSTFILSVALLAFSVYWIARIAAALPRPLNIVVLVLFTIGVSYGFTSRVTCARVRLRSRYN